MFLFVILVVFRVTVSAYGCGPCECKTIQESFKIAVCSHSKDKLNNISSDIDPEISGLYFTGQHLTKLENNSFIAFNKLQILLLGMNMIYEIDKDSFKNLSNLLTLDLSYNKLTHLPSNVFSGTPKLTNVQLHNNKLTYLATNLFSNLSYLTSINIQKNKISFIQENCFINLPMLYKIDMSSNNLRNLHPTIMDNSSSLAYFDLQENPWKCEKYRSALQEHFILKHEYMNSSICNTPAQAPDLIHNPIFWMIMLLVLVAIFILIFAKFTLCLKNEKEPNPTLPEIDQFEMAALQIDLVD